MAHSFKDVAGSDVTTICRTSLGEVRDAWVELCKPMVLKRGADIVAAATQSAKATGARVVPVFFLHV